MEVIQTPHAGPVDLETGDDVEANEPDAHMLDEPGILVREFLCYPQHIAHIRTGALRISTQTPSRLNNLVQPQYPIPSTQFLLPVPSTQLLLLVPTPPQVRRGKSTVPTLVIKPVSTLSPQPQAVQTS